MNQRTVFLNGEGDRWYRRNKHQLGLVDPVTPLINLANLKPASVLEIGAANGWRLDRLRAHYNCQIHGIDPSTEAASQHPNVSVGTAIDLHRWLSGYFDLVIYAFCLYLCDPTDYFRIVCEGDRVLSDGGHIIIHDFSSPVPFKRRYHHHSGVYSYHFTPHKLWLAHPGYHLKSHLLTNGDEEYVTLLSKDITSAFPERSLS